MYNNETIEKGVNIAPSSDAGHYVQNAHKVVNLDQLNETFLVEGKSTLVTKNHTSLEMAEDCMITCQNVYDPLTGQFNKSRD